jgi:hypothetical protein
MTAPAAHLITAIRRETAIIKHLATKVPAGQLNYRPTPPQRSTIDLLRYLTVIGVNATKYCLNGNWDHAKGSSAHAATLAVVDIPAAMDRQLAEIEAVLAPLTAADLANRTVAIPWGGKSALGDALLELPVGFLTAYRMQLFLYEKSSGASQLGTMDLWAGQSPPAKAAAH